MHTHTYIPTYIHTYIQLHAYIHACTRAPMHTCTFRSMYVYRMYIHTHVRSYVCMYACMYEMFAQMRVLKLLKHVCMSCIRTCTCQCICICICVEPAVNSEEAKSTPEAHLPSSPEKKAGFEGVCHCCFGGHDGGGVCYV